MDVLSKMLSRAIERDIMKGVKVGKDNVEVLYMQFADETISFLEQNDRSISNSLSLIQVFKRISELKINVARSGINGINIENDVVDHLAESIG